MPKDLEHIDVNELVPDTPPEELPELDILPAKRQTFRHPIRRAASRP